MAEDTYIMLLVDDDLNELLTMKASGREQDMNQWLDQQFRTLVF